MSQKSSRTNEVFENIKMCQDLMWFHRLMVYGWQEDLSEFKIEKMRINQ